MSQVRQQFIIDSSEGSSDEGQGGLGSPSGGDGVMCRVCGQPGAQMHYGALACVGCKGFFRRALKKIDQLECLGLGTCHITKDARTNCRSCRLRACLEAGMNPAAVRPDRDFTGKQRKNKKTPIRVEPNPASERIPSTSEEWGKRLSVEMRTMLMTLLNLETKISRGDTNQELSNLYPLKAKTLRELLEDPAILKGKRSEMRYERDRLCRNGELSPIAYRRLIAAIDWVEYLSELLPEKLSLEDRIALVKGSFLPLLVFKVSVRTAMNTQNPNVLCMCNFTYITRDVSKLYNDCYHWNNGLVDRVLDELVEPYRRVALREEEIVCLASIVVLNPLYKDLSEKASDMLIELRNKIQECLFAVIRETRPGQSSVHYGNILLSLPTVSTLANEMCENLVFAQTFSSQPHIPLMSNLFGCFPVEPFEEEQTTEGVRTLSLSSTSSSSSTISPKKSLYVDRAVQTDHPLAVRKRRLPESCKSPVESEPRKMPFSLREAPTDYTLAEMFDDLEQEAGLLPSTSQSSIHEEVRPRASSQPTQPENVEKKRSRSYLALSTVPGISKRQDLPVYPGYPLDNRSCLYRTSSHPNAPLLLQNSAQYPVMAAPPPNNLHPFHQSTHPPPIPPMDLPPAPQSSQSFVQWTTITEPSLHPFKPPLQQYFSHPQYPTS
ncbi:unnamed protein product, partial [Mesorhabditis belari]|uniref:Uncharacterized protein n=1 Tax=Mesorhabditis belari TaxID=2138241 RepID=A0AAF3FBZ8_9BILA